MIGGETGPAFSEPQETLTLTVRRALKFLAEEQGVAAEKFRFVEENMVPGSRTDDLESITFREESPDSYPRTFKVSPKPTGGWTVQELVN